MTVRVAKMVVLVGLLIYYALVVFNNLTDFNSNYLLVRHVLSMDTTFPGNHGMGRAITTPWVQLLFYLVIIAWEIVTTVMLGWGTMRMIRAREASAEAFNRAKNMAVAALLLSLLLWLVGFMVVGGEWFLMWQSQQWNGEQAAMRMFLVAGVVLLFVVQPERETQA